ncbi:MAG: hypothetical protein IGS03_10675 [Candidatus Sericytochromatia bacterium]|nr:hypothetical protein [Candidatus Sericytochromatia bacterium]
MTSRALVLQHTLKLSLCLTLLACQAPLTHTSGSSKSFVAIPETLKQIQQTTASLNTGSRPAEIFAHPLQLQLSHGQEKLYWQPEAGFRIQGVRTADIKSLRLRLSGPGISLPLETTTSVTTPGQWPALSLGPVPQGRFRVVNIEGLDANGAVLPGFRASAVYHSPANSAHSLALKRLYNPLADLVLRLLDEEPDYLENVDLDTLRARISGLSGELADNRYPHDPDFIESDALFALFDFNGPAGAIPEQTALNQTRKTPLSLDLYLQTPDGLNLNETLQVSLNHPTAPPQTLSPGQSLYRLRFERLFYTGTADQNYTLSVRNTSQQVATLNVRLGADGQITLDPANSLAGANGRDAGHALLLNGAAQSGFTTYFVNPAGSNTANGRTADSAWQTIQHAVDTAPAGSRIELAPGSYSEEVSINKVLQIVGAGSGADLASASHLIAPTADTGTGLALAGNGANTTERLSVSDLRIQGFSFGVSFSGRHISLENLHIRQNTNGLRVGSQADVLDLSIRNSQVEANKIGFYAAKDNPHTSNLRQLAISQSNFSGNAQKGLYFEKLSEASFDGLTVTNNGTATDYAWNAGLELNLKWKWGPDQDQDYSNIVIKNSQFAGNGVLGTAANRLNPASIAIKARDDAPSYNATGKPPAALSDVRLENNVIAAPLNALRLGETGKNSAGTTGVVLVDNQLNLSGTDLDPRYLIINQTTVGVDASSGNRFNGLASTAANGFAIENLLFDRLDQSSLGRINSGLPAGQLFVPHHSDGSQIQTAINLASPGDTLTLQDGVYNLNGRSLNLNKALTLQGQSLNTRLQQAYNAADSTRVLNISAAGARLRQLQIEKTNKTGVHNLVQISASNVTLEDLQISGLFENGDGDVSRALEIAGGLSGLLIQNNRIFGLRQPAYINPGSTGQINGNTVYGTRGWVIDGARMGFSASNRWRADGVAVNGDNPSQNFGCDIALLNNTNADYQNFYGALGSLEGSLGDLLAAGPGMTGCDQRVLP